REGQNARLAAKLTGWKIDIKSESQAGEDPALSGDEERWVPQAADTAEAAEEGEPGRDPTASAPETAEDDAEEEAAECAEPGEDQVEETGDDDASAAAGREE